MAPKKSELYSSLWSRCDELRSIDKFRMDDHIKGGFDPAQEYELIAQSSGAPKVWGVRGPFMVNRQYSKNSGYDIAKKDARII